MFSAPRDGNAGGSGRSRVLSRDKPRCKPKEKTIPRSDWADRNGSESKELCSTCGRLCLENTPSSYDDVRVHASACDLSLDYSFRICREKRSNWIISCRKARRTILWMTSDSPRHFLFRPTFLSCTGKLCDSVYRNVGKFFHDKIVESKSIGFVAIWRLRDTPISPNSSSTTWY